MIELKRQAMDEFSESSRLGVETARLGVESARLGVEAQRVDVEGKRVDVEGKRIAATAVAEATRVGLCIPQGYSSPFLGFTHIAAQNIGTLPPSASAPAPIAGRLLPALSEYAVPGARASPRDAFPQLWPSHAQLSQPAQRAPAALPFGLVPARTPQPATPLGSSVAAAALSPQQQPVPAPAPAPTPHAPQSVVVEGRGADAQQPQPQVEQSTDAPVQHTHVPSTPAALPPAADPTPLAATIAAPPARGRHTAEQHGGSVLPVGESKTSSSSPSPALQTTQSSSAEHRRLHVVVLATRVVLRPGLGAEDTRAVTLQLHQMLAQLVQARHILLPASPCAIIPSFLVPAALCRARILGVNLALVVHSARSAF